MEPSDRWILGWALGGTVVAVAATLLLAIIGLARRIVRQAGEVEDALDGARENTTALFELSAVNLTIDQATRTLRAMREGR